MLYIFNHRHFVKINPAICVLLEAPLFQWQNKLIVLIQNRKNHILKKSILKKKMRLTFEQHRTLLIAERENPQNKWW